MILVFTYPGEDTSWGCKVAAYNNLDWFITDLLRTDFFDIMNEDEPGSGNEVLEKIKNALQKDGVYYSGEIDEYYEVLELTEENLKNLKNGLIVFKPYRKAGNFQMYREQYSEIDFEQRCENAWEKFNEDKDTEETNKEDEPIIQASCLSFTDVVKGIQDGTIDIKIDLEEEK